MATAAYELDAAVKRECCSAWRAGSHYGEDLENVLQRFEGQESSDCGVAQRRTPVDPRVPHVRARVFRLECRTAAMRCRPCQAAEIDHHEVAAASLARIVIVMLATLSRSSHDVSLLFQLQAGWSAFHDV